MQYILGYNIDVKDCEYLFLYLNRKGVKPDSNFLTASYFHRQCSNDNRYDRYLLICYVSLCNERIRLGPIGTFFKLMPTATYYVKLLSRKSKIGRKRRSRNLQSNLRLR